MEHLNKMAGVFKAFGDVNRLKIIKMLASDMAGELCVSDIAEKLGITQPATSQHIKILKHIGVLFEDKIGFRVYYHINNEILEVLQAEINDLYKKAYEKCSHDYACSECSFNNKCL